MTPIKDTIAKVDELRAKATQGEWYHDKIGPNAQEFVGGNGYQIAGMAGAFRDSGPTNNAAYIVALHNAYDTLRKAVLRMAMVDESDRLIKTREWCEETERKAIAGAALAEYMEKACELPEEGLKKNVMAALEAYRQSVR